MAHRCDCERSCQDHERSTAHQRDTPTTLPVEESLSEKEWQAEVIAIAKSQGWKYYHAHDSRKCVEGFPDLLLLRGSVLIAAELKVGDNQPAAAQLNWLDWFAAVGAKTFVWYPRDFEQITTLLKG